MFYSSRVDCHHTPAHIWHKGLDKKAKVQYVIKPFLRRGNRGRSLYKNEWLQNAIFAGQQTKREKALVQKVDSLAENARIFERDTGCKSSVNVIIEIKSIVKPFKSS